MNRLTRHPLATLLLALLPVLNAAASAPSPSPTDKIDRHALVSRHNVVLTMPDRLGALHKIMAGETPVPSPAKIEFRVADEATIRKRRGF